MTHKFNAMFALVTCTCLNVAFKTKKTHDSSCLKIRLRADFMACYNIVGKLCLGTKMNICRDLINLFIIFIVCI